MRPLTTTLDELRRSFWLPSSLGMALGLAAGLLVPELDGWTAWDVPVVDVPRDSAASLLQTIATVTMSVVGISFSVVVVALQLASQQLGPRVLRTFETERMSKIVLALFVGTFIYCLAVLARLASVGERVPEVSVSVAVVLALVAFAFFVAFIHQIVTVLQASDLIKRIAVDGMHAIERRYPGDVGAEPADRDAAELRARRRMEAGRPLEVRAPRAGFLVGVSSDVVIEKTRQHDALVRQRLPIGDFAVTGALVAELWCDGDAAELVADVAHGFQLAQERTVVHDCAFPIRQLADVALRGLSPSLNDPTTAENAMNSLTDLLVRFAAGEQPSSVRVDDAGEPRFLATAPSLDDLVRLGFEQVRVAADAHPVLAVRLLAQLREVDRAAREAGMPCAEPRRQADLIVETVEGAVPTAADAEWIRDVRARVP